MERKERNLRVKLGTVATRKKGKVGAPSPPSSSLTGRSLKGERLNDPPDPLSSIPSLHVRGTRFGFLASPHASPASSLNPLLCRILAASFHVPSLLLSSFVFSESSSAFLSSLDGSFSSFSLLFLICTVRPGKTLRGLERRKDSTFLLSDLCHLPFLISVLPATGPTKPRLLFFSVLSALAFSPELSSRPSGSLLRFRLVPRGTTKSWCSVGLRWSHGVPPRPSPFSVFLFFALKASGPRVNLSHCILFGESEKRKDMPSLKQPSPRRLPTVWSLVRSERDTSTAPSAGTGEWNTSPVVYTSFPNSVLQSRLCASGSACL